MGVKYPKSPIEHHRASMGPRPDVGVEKTFLEERGIRSFKFDAYKDLAVTLAEHEFNQVKPLEQLDIMRRSANECLRAAGEPDYCDILAKARADGVPDGGDIERHLVHWIAGLVANRGHLSPEAIAAKFLTALDRVGMAGEEMTEGRWAAIAALCEAWHWHYFEAAGEHELCAIALKNDQGRQNGPKARREIARLKGEIVREAFNRLCETATRPELLNNATWVAGQIFEEVKRACNEATATGPTRVMGYTEGTLRKAVRTLIEERNR